MALTGSLACIQAALNNAIKENKLEKTLDRYVEPLHYQCWRSSSTNQKNRELLQALLIFVVQQNFEEYLSVANYVIQCGASLNSDEPKSSPLLHASSRRWVNYLRVRGACLRQTSDVMKQMPVELLATYTFISARTEKLADIPSKQIEAAKRFFDFKEPDVVENKSPAKIENSNNITRLHCAALSCVPEYIAAVPELKSEVNRCDRNGNTPMHWFIRGALVDVAHPDMKKMTQCFEMLMKAGVDLTLQNDDHYTPLAFVEKLAKDNKLSYLTHARVFKLKELLQAELRKKVVIETHRAPLRLYDYLSTPSHATSSDESDRSAVLSPLHTISISLTRGRSASHE